MTDDSNDDAKDASSEGEKSSAPSGRRKGAVRKISPSPDRATTPPAKKATNAATATAEKRPPRKLWQRGAFWFWIIVAEIVVALVFSFVYENHLENPSVAPGDYAVFCQRVTEYQTSAPGGLSTSEGAETFRKLQAKLRAMADVAPASVQDDLRTLADNMDKVIATAEEVQTKKQQDTTYIGSGELIGAIEQYETTNRIESTRFNSASLQACNIDFNATTTIAPATTAPTTAASTPTTTAVPGPLGPLAPAGSTSTTAAPTTTAGPAPGTTSVE